MAEPATIEALIAELGRRAAEAEEIARPRGDDDAAMARARRRSSGAAVAYREAQRLAEAVLRASGWRPIAEAPKDGSEFLAFWKAPGAPTPKSVVARWVDDPPWVGFYGVNVQSGDGHGTIAHLEWGHPSRLCATHWMPLPTPPSDTDPGAAP